MERQFRRVGWPAEFVDAVEGMSLDLASMRSGGLLHMENEGLTGPMSPGEVGCALSHAEVWRIFRSSRSGYALICEDDVVLPDAFDLWTLLRWAPGDADLVYLHYLNDQDQNLMGAAFDSDKDKPVVRAGGFAIFSAWSCGGSACYLVSQRGARTLLEHVRPLRYPSDGLLARLSDRGVLRAYALSPKPVAIYPFNSTIR
jgi:glycosyl transferase family 25